MTNFESILGRVALALLALGFFLPSVAREELYSTTFEDEDEFNTWTIVDMNGGRSWEFLSDHGNGVAAYMHDMNDLPGDDWYISPGISMEVDNIYELVFTFGVKTRVENMSVWVGSSLYPDDFTIELHDFNSVTSDDSGTYTYKFTVPESGEWHIGFYAYSEPNTHRVQIDDVIVNYVSSALVPGEVTDLTVVAGEKASKNATISFVTPTVSILGDTLLEPSNIIIKRNAGASAIASFENVGEGEALSYVDEDAEYGLNVYNIIAYNSYGESEVAVDSVWVGHDTAVAVSELSVRLTPELEVLLEWAEPTSSVHGGYVDYESLTYTISCEGQTVAEGVSGVSYTYSADSRSQTLISFIITPVSEGGEGESAQSVNLLYGEPLFPPYSESFAGCEFEGIEWYQDETCCDFVWQLDTDDDDYEIYPYDSDGGMLRAYRSSWWPGKQSRVISPLFYLDGMKNPTLSFYLLYLQSPYYDYALDGVITDRVQVQVSIDGGEWEDVNNACFIYGQESLGWTLCQVMLPRSEGSFVQIAFLALPESEGSSYRDCYIDAISIDEGECMNDLKVNSLSVNSKRISIGETLTFETEIINRGAEAESDYTIELYCNDELYATIEGETIKSNGNLTYSFETAAARVEDAAGEGFEWYVRVVLEGDENELNDVSESISTTVREGILPVVENLRGEILEGTVTLQWDAQTSAPYPTEYEAIEVFDDFESYESFIIDEIGPWTTYDADGCDTMNTSRIPNSYAHKGEPMAFQVFNIEESGVVTEDSYDTAFVNLHGGVQYLVCPSTNYPDENDDWLISPRVYPGEHTISFKAMSVAYTHERIRVMYSTTDMHPDSFLPLHDDQYIDVEDWWWNYSFTVPAGARYFAINCNYRCVMLLMDNFTYYAHDGQEDGRTLIGYNLYRDGELVNDILLTSTEYEVALEDFEDGSTYRVTAVYEEGESYYSNPYNLDILNGIEQVAGGSQQVAGEALYDLSGRRVSAANKSGIYLQKKGNKTNKLIIK